MSEASPEETSGPAGSDGGIGAVASPGGMSPYATGGGVTFERKVAAQYLSHLLVGDGASELGHGRCVVSVAFQQAPGHPVDDLVVSAALPDELEPSLVLELGVRRSPDLVLSNESTRRLIREFVRAVINAPADGPERRLGLVVAGPQQHAEQLATLADLAAVQMDAPGFFDLVRTPNKFDAGDARWGVAASVQPRRVPAVSAAAQVRSAAVLAGQGTGIRTHADRAARGQRTYRRCQLSAAGTENVVIVIPPRRSALSAGPTDGPWAQRDTALERIRQVGRREWQKESGYRQQARVENSFFRYKSVLGGGLKARHGKAQRREVAIGCHILNRMAELGRPKSCAVVS